MAENTTLLNEIGALIEAPSVDRADVERTLTDGYAHALTLEVERSRLQKQLAELTRSLHRDDAVAKTGELRALTRRLEGIAAELARLRARLAELRRVSR